MAALLHPDEAAARYTLAGASGAADGEHAGDFRSGSDGASGFAGDGSEARGQVPLGAGAFGSVRAATDRAHPHAHACAHVSAAALKTVRMPRLEYSDSDYDSDEGKEDGRVHMAHGVPDQVMREALCLAALSAEPRHPNTLGLRSAHASGSSLVLATDRCRCSLADVLARAADSGIVLPERIVRGVVAQCAAGVAAVHAENMLHRDVKPGNFLVSADGRVVLADFGQARLQTQTKSRAPGVVPGGDRRALVDRVGQYSHAVATRWYRAPELLYGATAYSEGVDVWALGCVIAELLGGGPLLPGLNDIAQLARVQLLRGALTPREWAGVEQCPDYGKVHVNAPPLTDAERMAKLAAAVPDASADAVALVDAMLAYDPCSRPHATDVLACEWLLRAPVPAAPAEVAEAFTALELW